MLSADRIRLLIARGLDGQCEWNLDKVLAEISTEHAGEKAPDGAGASVPGEIAASNLRQRGRHPVEPIVNPALNHINRLGDTYKVRCATAGIDCDRGCAKIDVVIFNLRRPIGCEAPFNTATNNPAAAIGTGGWKEIEARGGGPSRVAPAVLP